MVEFIVGAGVSLISYILGAAVAQTNKCKCEEKSDA